MISVGLAELEEYELVARCKVPPQVAVATSIFVVVRTVLVAVVGHAYTFLSHADDAAIQQVVNIATFTVPGVIIGGQIGPRLSAHISPDVLKVGISLLFMAVGGFMLATLAM